MNSLQRKRRYRNPEQAKNRKKIKATAPQLVQAIRNMNSNGIPGRASRISRVEDSEAEYNTRGIFVNNFKYLQTRQVSLGSKELTLMI